MRSLHLLGHPMPPASGTRACLPRQDARGFCSLRRPGDASMLVRAAGAAQTRIRLLGGTRAASG